MWLDILQLVLAIALMGLILIQGKGSGLGGVFGGNNNVYRTKRGAEKVLHNATILISVAFFGLALLNVLY